MSVKNNQVQFLRGIACLVIVFFHYYCRYEQIYFNNYQYPLLISEMGTIGVLIFWLLSGYYLIPNREINSIQYILNRGYKLYPPYLISIIMIYLLSFSGYLGANREVSISDFLKNVIMVNGFIASPYVDGAHWYLTYTVTFILIASILILLKKQHDINYYMIWLLINVILCMSTKVVDNPIIKILLLMSGGSYAPVVIIGVIFRQINENILETNKSRLALIFSFFAILLTSGKLYFLEALIMSCIVWVVINKSVKIINNDYVVKKKPLV